MYDALILRQNTALTSALRQAKTFSFALRRVRRTSRTYWGDLPSRSRNLEREHCVGVYYYSDPLPFDISLFANRCAVLVTVDVDLPDARCV